MLYFIIFEIFMLFDVMVLKIEKKASWFNEKINEFLKSIDIFVLN